MTYLLSKSQWVCMFLALVQNLIGSSRLDWPQWRAPIHDGKEKAYLGQSGSIELWPTSVASPPTPNRSVAEFNFDECDGPIFVRVWIKDTGPFWFGLDTGAFQSLIDTATAQKAGLTINGTRAIGGAAGTETGASAEDVTLRVPGFGFHSLRLSTVSLDQLAAKSGHEMGGILGSELFDRNVVEIDYERRIIRLYDPHAYKYGGTGERIPLKVELGVPYVRARLSLAGLESTADSSGGN